ncbi:MAG: calcium:proton antiporter [Myxococcota bacterium]|nr:calcium:proton antiporter [Myxococcota bacterium]
MTGSQQTPGRFAFVRAESALWIGVIAAIGFGSAGADSLSATTGFLLAVLTAILFGVILAAAFGVVRHADALAVQLGEPYGTLILTLSVISIEVMMISAVMLTGDENPTLARETMYAVIMIVLNGMVGVTLILGGLRHHEQEYNLQGANAFLAVILPLAVLVLVLPNYTQSTEGPTLSVPQEIFLSLVSIGLYAVFLAVQTVRHRSYFVAPNKAADPDAPDLEDEHPGLILHAPWVHGALLVAYLAPIVFLAKLLAIPIDIGIHRFGAPAALGGFVVAVLVLSPEVMSAVRAALANRLQRSVNIFLGSVAATIALTVPAVLAISMATQKTVTLGLPAVDSLLLMLTLAVSVVTFASGRTNVLQGAVHLVLFFAYLVLIFD